MLFVHRCRVFMLLVAVVCIVGCDTQTPTDKIQVRFDEVKNATTEFHQNMVEITDKASAERILPELESSHERLAEAFNALDEATLTSSRGARKILIDVEDYKKDQRELLKIQFDRLKEDEFVKAVVEPFMRRINAFKPM
ncbi:hypothetical protein N9B31_02255 [Mariniblastus sp.]|nr:hypothetical protein [Mariniblastus sp.]MDA7902458.1 hypothetical protein [Mariniblastus sp.]MDA7905362.1 hypothetical protein [Mariniblastus sp.]